jgi:hypothetical protein
MHDMRELLDRAQAVAPPPVTSVDDIVRRGRQRHRRVRVGRVTGIALAAVSLATAGSMLIAGPQPTGGAPTAGQPAVDRALAPPARTAAVPAPAPPFTFTYSGYRTGDLRVLDPTLVSLTYQAGNIVRDSSDPTATPQVVGRITVFRPGAFDPTGFASGTPVTVNGRPGFQLLAQPFWLGASPDPNQQIHLIGPGGTEVTSAPVDLTAWQYADGAWATIEGEPALKQQPPLTAAQQLTTAERFALTADRPRVAKTVAKAGYLPEGLALLAVDEDGMLTAAYGRPNPAGTMFRTGDHGVDRVPGVSLEISLLVVDNPPPDAKPMHGRCREGLFFCTGTLPGGRYDVVVEDPSHTRTDAELLQVLDHLQLADPDNPLSWYPVA